MKTRGTRGGILLSLDKEDTPESLEAIWKEHGDLLEGKVVLEIPERIPFSLVDAVVGKVKESGGEVTELRPPNAVVQTKGETVVISRTIRSGARIESTGSAIILGDVNAGAEILAADDIIVIGNLRGIAHAGANGNEGAIIWAQRILSPQLRIAGALAQAGDHGGVTNGAEVAHLRDGNIVLRPWDR